MQLEWWQITVVMVAIVALILLPVFSWYLHKRYTQSKKNARARTVPPLMYIATVSTRRASDIDIPVIPSPNDPGFLPPSYEEIYNGSNNQSFMASSTSLNIHNETLPDYESVASHQGSVVLSTFYNDTASSARSVSAISDDEADPESVSQHSEEGSSRAPSSPTTPHELDLNPAFSREDMGVYIA